MAYLNNASGTLLVGTADIDQLDSTFSILVTTLAGGFGNDIYIIDSGDDILLEEAAGGTDTVRSHANYELAAFLETLILLGDDDLEGTGNELNNALTGNAGDNVLDGAAGNDTMAGGLGDDEYRVDSAADAVIEAANAGHDEVSASVSYTLALNVEDLELTGSRAINGTGNAANNAIEGNEAANILLGLAGDDELAGGDGNDRLDGGAGNDRLTGGDGVDTLVGGAGDDTYELQGIEDAGDIVQEAANGGNDTVETDRAHTLAANVENLILAAGASSSGGLRGNALNNYIQGNELNNVLFGDAGNDTLDGRGGADLMSGSTGNDTYVVDDIGDRIIESANATSGAADKAIVSVTFYQLADNVENIQLVGGAYTAYGNSGNNVMTGNGQNNFLLAFDGNDVLDGGAGADNLQGGKGNDTYYYDSTGDYAQEMKDEGTDTVFTSVTYNFYGSFYLENMTLTGTADGDITGNDQANIITGNAGANFLNGRGGFDTMAGGLGDDTYIVDKFVLNNAAASDKVVEAANAGIDTVISFEAYTLAANVENLVLGNTAGNISGTGNALNNRIDGNAGSNNIDGGAGNDELRGFGGNDTLLAGAGNDVLDGGVGSDTMMGGAGDDTYYADNAGDIATEAANGGIDTVRSSVSWTLAANFENLALQGLSHLSGTGNDLANNLIGNDGNNTLTGGNGNDFLDGGAGVDFMVGGAGNDTYVQDDITDELVEDANGGIDTLQIRVSRGDYDVDAETGAVLALKINFENLVMLGDDDLQGGGNDLSNTITGNAGSNVLSGRGLGTDRLAGGKGDDIYFVDQATDAVVELANEGFDHVFVDFTPAGTYVLGANLEVARFSLLASNIAVNANGNALDNGLEGNAAANRLDGGAGNDYVIGNGGGDTLIGGLGNDYLLAGGGTASMTGGAGDDWYVISARSAIIHTADATIVEAAGQGTDTIQTTVDFDMSVLAANVENLYLDHIDFYSDDPGYFAGAEPDIEARGNALDNKIFGNLGNNSIEGLGGNDTFYFHTYEMDLSAWAAVTGDPVPWYAGASFDQNDSVDGGSGTDVLHAALFGVNGQLHIHDVEQITLYSGTNTGSPNVIDASDITGTGVRITISDPRLEDYRYDEVTGDPVTQFANIALTGLQAGTDITLIDFSGGLNASLGSNTASDSLDLTLTRFFGDITTSGIETVVLNVDQPSDLSVVAANLEFSTGLDHIVVSGRSGEIFLRMNADADLALDNANLNVYLSNHDSGPFSIGVNSTGASFIFQDGPVSQLDLDTSGNGGASSIGTVGTATGLVTVTGNQHLSISLGQDIDATNMTGNLNAGTYGLNGNYSLKGGEGSDILNGGTGDDRLNGGRLGNDELYGNAGNDTFVFDTAPVDGHFVYMSDFTSGSDHIELSSAAFAGLSAGQLDQADFFRGDASGISGQHIAFDANTGNLYFDADGVAGGSQLFANLWYGNNIEHTDITIV